VAVAVVDEDEHKNRELVVSRFPVRIDENYLRCGNMYLSPCSL
jgi:hypothetical protein